MEFLFELVQIALGFNKRPMRLLSDKEWLDLYKVSEKQAILGLLLLAIERLLKEQRPDHKLLLQWIGVGEMIRDQGRAVNHGVIQLHQLMKNAGVDYSVVKGQVVASCYPEPLLRQSGDVDYYCDETNFDKAQNAIRTRWGIVAEGDGTDHHVHFNYDGVVYEGHFTLIRLYNKKKESYWKDILSRDGGATVIIDGSEIKTLSPTLHTLYVFLHLYSHLMKLGVGLRQFCDLAVMLHYMKGKIDMDALRGHLQKLGMERGYRASGSILVDYLGLPEEELGYTLSGKDRRYGKKIINVVMYRGNMGHYEMVHGSWLKVNGYVRQGKLAEIRRKMGAVGIKLSHFMKFWRLAPGYSWGWLCHEVKRNI